ncbi:MAG: MFS transporter [Burkholderiales bacterium]|nr:MFS transporter [Burkholderiales bacterium]
MVVAGFGLGAVVYNLTLQHIPSFATAAQAAAELAAAPETLRLTGVALAQEHVSALMNVFVVSGIAFALIGGSCALMLENPPTAYRRKSEAVGADFNWNRSYTTARMLRTPQFYLLWLMLFLNVTAGILIISNAVPIMQELTGLAPGMIAATYGFVALFNALGRFFWGAISDRIGRNRTFALIFSLQAIAFGMLGGLHDLTSVAIGFAVVLLCFGGGFGTMPSFAADYFGTRRMGANYGMILSAWGFAGIVGPLFAAHMKDTTGSYGGTLMPIALMLLVAMLLPMITKRPARGGKSVTGRRRHLSSNAALAGASAQD